MLKFHFGWICLCCSLIKWIFDKFVNFFFCCFSQRGMEQREKNFLFFKYINNDDILLYEFEKCKHDTWITILFPSFFLSLFNSSKIELYFRLFCDFFSCWELSSSTWAIFKKCYTPMCEYSLLFFRLFIWNIFGLVILCSLILSDFTSHIITTCQRNKQTKKQHQHLRLHTGIFEWINEKNK